MNTIEDAWRWFRAFEGGLMLNHRLATRYWEDLPWDGAIGRDDRFRLADAQSIQLDSRFGLDQLNDLAVLVLFSVFEATVRQKVRDEVIRQSQGIENALLISAIDDLQRAIEEGSFFRVLDPFKVSATPELVEEVHQVRRYRNWVAHGRRWIAARSR
jgi:hypothetical protein